MEMRDLLNNGRANFEEMHFKIISDKNLNSKYLLPSKFIQELIL